MMKDYVIVQRPALMVVGIECRTSNHPDAGPVDIPQQWGKFYSQNISQQIPNKASNDIIALYCDYEGDYTQPYSLVIGCPTTSLDNIPEGMVAKKLPATFYAIYHAVGAYPQSLIETWGKIWQTPLERTYTGDYEVYGDKFTSSSPQEVDVYIAIKK